MFTLFQKMHKFFLSLCRPLAELRFPWIGQSAKSWSSPLIIGGDGRDSTLAIHDRWAVLPTQAQQYSSNLVRLTLPRSKAYRMLPLSVFPLPPVSGAPPDRYSWPERDMSCVEDKCIRNWNRLTKRIPWTASLYRL